MRETMLIISNFFITLPRLLSLNSLVYKQVSSSVREDSIFLLDLE